MATCSEPGCAASVPPEFFVSGFATRPAAPRLLRAGPLTMDFDAGDLRYIRYDGREVIRRIYAAVRDRNWTTIPPVLHDLSIEAGSDSFRICFDAEHRHDDIHFVWHGELTGAPDGAVRFEFDGAAKTTFLANRIGCCVLHPVRECAGASCRVERTNGMADDVAFPRAIAAEQPVPGFHDLRALAHEVAPGIWIKVHLHGDVFEMEDQRNWLDASYKTYSTPLRLPYPVEVQAGTRVRQSIILRIEPDTAPSAKGPLDLNSLPRNSSIRFAAAPSSTDAAVRIDVDWESLRPMPRVGLCAADCEQRPSEAAITRLRRLNLHHLRIDVPLGDRKAEQMLLQGRHLADAISVPMELALHVPADGSMDVSQLRECVAQTRLSRILVLQDSCRFTPADTLAAVRVVVGSPGIPIGAGTQGDLLEINQERPRNIGADFICWSMTPQWHACDNRSIAETPATVVDQIARVRDLFPDVPLIISPVTLKPRTCNDAAGSQWPLVPGKLPALVDARQFSLFGAAWTLAMLKQTAHAGASSVTFYETVGLRGIIEFETGATSPALFPASPAAVYPMYHVFADVAECQSCAAAQSSDSLQVEALAVRTSAGRRHILIANLQDRPCSIELREHSGAAGLTLIDETNVEFAMQHPEAFRELPSEMLRTAGHAMRLTLQRYALARLDFP